MFSWILEIFKRRLLYTQRLVETLLSPFIQKLNFRGRRDGKIIALPNDLGPIPSTHLAAHNCL